MIENNFIKIKLYEGDVSSRCHPQMICWVTGKPKGTSERQLVGVLCNIIRNPLLQVFYICYQSR